MKKKKYLSISLIILICILVSIISIILAKNKNNEDTPIDYLVAAINDNDSSKIPNAFHKYCSLSIEQNISNEDFEEYIDTIIDDFGNNYKMTYKIINSEKLSKEDTSLYETDAIHMYSGYPYLANGGKLKFEYIVNVTANLSIRGSKQEENGNVDFLIAKIDGKFYFLHIPNQLTHMFIRY